MGPRTGWGNVYDVQSLATWVGHLVDRGPKEGRDVEHYPKYSIVIPAYNEGGRIPATLRAVVDCIRSRGWDAEVLVVNDGSRDNTAAVVREIAATAPEIRLLENPANRGKGYSVRHGILHALGDIVMFTDADL